MKTMLHRKTERSPEMFLCLHLFFLLVLGGASACSTSETNASGRTTPSSKSSNKKSALGKGLWRIRPETDEASNCLLRTLNGRYVLSVLEARCSGTGLALREAITLAILEESSASDLDPMVVLGLIHVESRFDVFARSSAGAQGLVQLQPATARHMAELELLDLDESEIASDPELQVRLGIRYLASLKKRFQTWENALIAYNAGPTKLQRILSKNGSLAPFVSYPRSVFRSANRFERARDAFREEMGASAFVERCE